LRGWAIFIAGMLILPTGARATGITGGVDVVTDYRFRGISQSYDSPAVQGTLNVSQGPLFAEAFVTSLGHSERDARVETDLSIGGTRQFGKTTVTLSSTWYLYPRYGHEDMAELLGRVDQPLGRATFSMLVGYAPPQRGLHGRDNIYLGLSAKVPIGRPHLFASIGRERGALAPVSKIDWQLGIATTIAGFDASISYVDCNRHVRDWEGRSLSGATAVFQFGHSF
jgi:uncharacterized protein (TIGR02001 family)